MTIFGIFCFAKNARNIGFYKKIKRSFKVKNIIKTLIMALLIFGMTAIPANAMTIPVYRYSFYISNKALNVEKGDRFTLSVTGMASSLGTTMWSSSNEDVLQIESVESGKYLSKNYKANVVAVGTGKASIIAKNTKNSDALSCSVTVGNAEESQQEKPVITNAVSTGTSKAGKIKLEWTTVGGAKQYRVQISKSPDFSTTFRDITTKNTYYNTGWNYYNQVGSGTVFAYYCRVSADNGDWSDVVICEQK